MTNTNTMNKLAQTLAYNRDFTGKNKVKVGETVSADDFKAWKSACETMQEPAYRVACNQHNGINDESSDKCRNILYTLLSNAMDLIGNVQGHKLDTKALADIVIASAWTWKASDKLPKLQYVRSQKNNAMRLLKTYLSAPNGVDKNTIAAVQADIQKYADKIAELEAQAGARTQEFERVSPNAFRAKIEMLFGDVIREQAAMTWEALEARDEAKKAERRAKTKAKKQDAKKQAAA